MKIYTKTGDNGKTSLFGGQRVDKDNLRLEAYGTVDELNSNLSLVILESSNAEVKEILTKVQHELFNLGAVLATPDDKKDLKRAISVIENERIEALEKTIDHYVEQLPEQKYFILPGGSRGSTYLHVARAVCRRTERRVTTLAKSVEIDKNIIIYLNRLSDLLFVLARFENFVDKTPDVPWNPK